MRKNYSLIFVIMLMLCLFASEGFSESWGYEGAKGPEHWSHISNKYYFCGHGKNQSPINITGAIKASGLSDIKFNYVPGGKEVVNNGHAAQVNYGPGSSIAIDDKVFKLKQLHFHSPSENKVDGESFPLEAHLVHADGSGNLAVVSILFKEGDANTFLSKFWKDIPKTKGSKALAEDVNVVHLLPKDKSYYRFNGSLTTPPCSEGVYWFVMKTPLYVSKQQVAHFSSIMGHPNNRPVQKLNARKILY